MTSLVFLVAGFGASLIALRTKDEVNRIAALIAGSIFLIWGFALTPQAFQILVEVAIIIPVFSICMRCLGCGLTR